jgi:hypothetical protein
LDTLRKVFPDIGEKRTKRDMVHGIPMQGCFNSLFGCHAFHFSVPNVSGERTVNPPRVSRILHRLVRC